VLTKSHSLARFSASIAVIAWLMTLMLVAAPAMAQSAAEADLEVLVSDGDAVIEPGDVLTYTVVLGNRGPADAEGVQLFNAVPEGTQFMSAEPTQGDCGETGGIVTCDIGEIANGSAVRVLVSVEIGDLPDTTVANTFVGSSTTTDPDPMNNTDEEFSSTIEVLPLTGAVEQVILPLATAAILMGIYLLGWARRSQSVHVVRRVG